MDSETIVLSDHGYQTVIFPLLNYWILDQDLDLSDYRISDIVCIDLLKRRVLFNEDQISNAVRHGELGVGVREGEFT
jgi:hypothetical protein